MRGAFFGLPWLFLSQLKNQITVMPQKKQKSGAGGRAAMLLLESSLPDVPRTAEVPTMQAFDEIANVPVEKPHQSQRCRPSCACLKRVKFKRLIGK